MMTRMCSCRVRAVKRWTSFPCDCASCALRSFIICHERGSHSSVWTPATTSVPISSVVMNQNV